MLSKRGVRLRVVLAWGCIAGAAFGGEDEGRPFLNPDGSGKVVHRAVFSGTPDDFQGLEEAVREKIRNELELSYGVEAWSKPLVRRLDGPRNEFEFEATAYFRDVRQLRFYNQGLWSVIQPGTSLNPELPEKPAAPSVSPSSGKPRFDYAAEVAAARDQWAHSREQLGLPGDFAPPGLDREGRPIVMLKLSGSAVSRPDPGANSPLPLTCLWPCPPSGFIRFTRCSIEQAEADDGGSLRDKARSYFVRDSFLTQGFPEHMVFFDLPLPGPKAKAISMIAGTLAYLEGSTETRVVDLGFNSIAAGSEGTASGVKILRMSAEEFPNDRFIRYEVQIPESVMESDRIRGLLFFDAKGRGLDTAAAEAVCVRNGKTAIVRSMVDGEVARIAIEEYREVTLREARFRVRPVVLEPAEP